MASDSPFAAFEDAPGELVGTQEIASWLMGPTLMGLMFHFLFYGVVGTAFVSYLGSERHKVDTWRVRAIAHITMALETVAVCISFAQLHFHGTLQRRDPLTMLFTDNLDAAPSVVAGAVGAFSQIILSNRAGNCLTRRKQTLFLWVLRPIIVLSFLASALMSTFIALVTKGVRFGPDSAAEIYAINIIAAGWLMMSAAIDITISTVLFIALRVQSRLFGNINFGNKQGRGSFVLMTVVQSASYTAVIATAGALTAVVFPRDAILPLNVFLAFTFPLPGLYAFSVMLTLASRDPLAERPSAVETGPHGSGKRTSPPVEGGLPVCVNQDGSVFEAQCSEKGGPPGDES